MTFTPLSRAAALFLPLCAIVPGLPLAAQQNRAIPTIPVPPPAYPVFADLVLAAPVIVDATIRSTTRLKPTDAPGLLPGKVRLYIEADVLALVRGPQALPPRIGYLLDVTPDSRGRLASLKKLRVLLFGRGVPGSANQLQLVGPDAQRDWTPAADALTRRITTETVKADAPPAITGVGNAFHTPGALPGEGETQIFLTTAQNRPVSLGIVRRPNAQPSWSVSLGDVVGADAGVPARDTLLWYRLACSLPATLPETASADAAPADATIAREDYRFVLAALGPCTR